jgi:squalene-hopene/tetraprenyl-beta-curcumene cyclase
MRTYAATLALVALFAQPGLAIDDAHRVKARGVLDKAFGYLRSQQTPEGAWSPKPGPAVTGLVVAGMLRDEAIHPGDAAVQKGVAYILTRQKENGGIYDELLENYNTSICLMALGELRGDPKLAAAVAKAQDYLRGLQWDQEQDPTGTAISEKHPWYGGAGYGNRGRPDLSNTAMMIAGLHDSGLDCKDPAYVRAMSFITRLQGSKANTEYGDQIVSDGGFVYATSENKENIGKPQSFATPDRETDSAGKTRLRTYGSMTYAGFMSYLYAELDRDDPRVRDAFDWVRRNYNLAENPGAGRQGYYYYLHLFARAMSAWDEERIKTADGVEHDWANELIDKLAGLQKPDGSFANDADRWMEGDPVLVTAYSVLALRHALQGSPVDRR